MDRFTDGATTMFYCRSVMAESRDALIAGNFDRAHALQDHVIDELIDLALRQTAEIVRLREELDQ
jgi:hypothetical protein